MSVQKTKSTLDTSEEEVFKGFDDLIEKRNRFFKYMGAAVVIGGLILSIPRWQLSRRTRNLYKLHCRGHVLDLSPKLLDGSSVALYESTPCLKVNFLVDTVINTDAEYKDLVAEMEEDDPKRKLLAKDMTIKFLESNDHAWVNSEVTFEVIPRSNPVTFDTVVLHSELWQHATSDAQALLKEASNRLRDRVLLHPKVATKKTKGGKVRVAPTQPEAKESNQTARIIVVDMAVPKRYKRTVQFLKWVHDQTESNIYFTHDLPPMFEEAGLEVLEHHPFFGVYHFYALQKKPPTAIPEPIADDEEPQQQPTTTSK